MNDEKWYQRRREFIRHMGVGAAGAALLPAWIAESGRARADIRQPRRLIIIPVANGMDRYFRSALGSDGVLSLGNLPDEHIFSPLKPHQNEVTVVGSIDTAQQRRRDGRTLGGGHAAHAFLLTGAPPVPVDFYVEDNPRHCAGGPSIDEFVHAELSKQMRFELNPFHTPALPMTNTNRQSFSHVGASSRSRANPRSPQNDPVKLFNDLFTADSGGDASSNEAARRAFVLDHAHRQARRFARNMGQDYAARSERLLESIASTRRQVTTLAGSSGRAIEPVLVSNDGYDSTVIDHRLNRDNYMQERGNRSVAQRFHVYASMVVDAMAADRARTALMPISDSTDNRLYLYWKGPSHYTQQALGELGENPGTGDPRGHHTVNLHRIAHESLALDSRKGHVGRVRNDAIQENVRFFASVLSKLKAVPEGAGTMLDNTLVVLANTQETGGGHATRNITWILGGSCGGRLQTGKLMLRPGQSQVSNVAIWNEVARAMGVSATFGTQAASYNNNPLGDASFLRT